MFILESEQADKNYYDVLEAAFKRLGVRGNAVIELIFMSEEEIHELNLRTRNVDRATDVLSYPFLSEWKDFTKENYPDDYDDSVDAVRLGCIAVCNEVAKKQAAEYGHSEIREKSYLFLHGILHLMGYDHIEENDKRIMRAKEEEILNDIGVTR